MDQGNAESWDSLRKQARKLESELDAKLTFFRKAISLPGGDAEGTLECELDISLKNLQQTNLQMQLWVPSACSDVLSHTLARHKDIVNELNQEFQRLRSVAKAKREHEKLLENFRSGEEREDYSQKRPSGNSHQALLNEQRILQKSTVEVDGVIVQAHAAFNALTTQHFLFNDISTKINTIGAKLPSVNGVLTAIRRKKSKDTIILALVASICTFLILVYWLSK